MTVEGRTPLEREEDLQEKVGAAAGRKIPIANLYHLLCYAWEFFELDKEVGVDVDNHNGYAELLTKVLTAGSVHLLKQGLHRDYQAVTESMRAIRGKLELARPLQQDGLSKASPCAPTTNSRPTSPPTKSSSPSSSAWPERPGWMPSSPRQQGVRRCG